MDVSLVRCGCRCYRGRCLNHTGPEPCLEPGGPLPGWSQWPGVPGWSGSAPRADGPDTPSSRKGGIGGPLPLLLPYFRLRTYLFVGGHRRTIHLRQTTCRNRVGTWRTHTSTPQSSQYQVLPLGAMAVGFGRGLLAALKPSRPLG
jgi:hypothetical protein